MLGAVTILWAASLCGGPTIVEAPPTQRIVAIQRAVEGPAVGNAAGLCGWGTSRVHRDPERLPFTSPEPSPPDPAPDETARVAPATPEHGTKKC